MLDSETAQLLRQYGAALAVGDFETIVRVLEAAEINVALSEWIERYHAEITEEPTEEDKAKIRAIVKRVLDEHKEVNNG